MAFFSPMAAFVTGAANQFNENIERQRVEDRQNDLIWANKFEKGKAEYEKEQKDSKEKTKLYNTLKSMTQGNEKLADAAFQAIDGNPKKSLDAYDWIARQLSSGATGFTPDKDYQSQSLSGIQDSLSSKYQNLQDLQGQARQPSLFNSGNSFANNMQMPQSPGSGGQQQQSSSASQMPAPTSSPGGFTPPQPASNSQPIGISTPGNVTDPSTGAPASYGPTGAIKPGSGSIDTQIGNAPPGGAPISLDTPDQAAPAPGQTAPTATPTPTISPAQTAQNTPTPPVIAPLKPNLKVDPQVQAAITEFYKQVPHVPTENRQAYIDSIRTAIQSGDPTKVRVDLLPSQADIDEQANRRVAGATAIKSYETDLSKRAQQLPILDKADIAASQMIKMVTTGDMHASVYQPLLDSVNNAFFSAGIDLKHMGFPANRLEDSNQFGKFLSDLTFDQIPNYHLGRWTNTEFNLLKSSLPSLNTDPSTVVKVALLFQNAAKREKESVKQENAIAYGPNGQNIAYPDPRDIGKAITYRNSTLTDNGQKPWLESPPAGTSPDKVQQFLQDNNGHWIETHDHRMGQIREGQVWLMPRK